MAENEDQMPEIGQEAAEAKDNTLPLPQKQETETSKFKRDKLSLKSLDGAVDGAGANLSDTAADGPSQIPPATEERIADPAALRNTNTANLKRIRPATEVATPGDVPAEPGKETDTETIHLKVIKEKKNVSQLKNLLSASQTIRLRPTQSPASAAAQAAAGVEIPSPPTAPVSANLGAPPPAGEDSQKRTLKIKAPAFESAPASQPPGAATQAATAVPTETGQVIGGANPRSTLKIKAAPGSTGVSNLVSPAAAAAGAEQQKKKSTLKIKAPTSAATGPGTPVSRAAAPVAPAAPSAETLRQNPALPASSLAPRSPTPTQQLMREKEKPPVAPLPAAPLSGRAPTPTQQLMREQPPVAAAPPQPTVAAAPVTGTSPAQQTVRQEPAPAAAGTNRGAKTLKLRTPRADESTMAPASAPPAPTDAAAPPAAAAVTEAQGSPAVTAPMPAAPAQAPAPTIASRRAAVKARAAEEAGVLYTLAAAASICLLAGVLYYAVRACSTLGLPPFS